MPPKKAGPATGRQRVEAEPSPDARAVLERLSPRLRGKVESEAGEDGDRSRHCWATTCALVEAGVGAADILALVADRMPFVEKAWSNRGTAEGALA